MVDPRATLRTKIREDHLTCSICFNTFTTPKALPCLHTFCEKCIGDYAVGYEALGRFPCPVCRNETVIPPGGVHYLQDNHLVKSLTETVETTSVPKVPPRPAPHSLPVSDSTAAANGGRASPQTIPAVPPRPKSITPPPQRSTVGMITSSVMEGVTGAIGQVGVALSDFNPLKQHSKVDAPQGATLGTGFVIVPNPREEGRSSPALYPQLSDPADKSGPCMEGMLLKFGQYGPGISDFLKPYGLAVGHSGEFVVSDRGGNRIFVFSNSGELQSRFNTECVVNGITITKENHILIAVSKSGSSIMRMYTMEGRFIQSYGDYYKFDVASGITITPKNQVAITNLAADSVLIFTDQRKFSTKFGRKGMGDNHFMQPQFISSTSKGYVVVSDTGSHSVKILDTTGIFKRSFGGVGNQNGRFNTPLGVAVDAEDNIFVADSSNFRVEVYTNKGQYYSTLLKETNLIGPDVRPINVAVTPRNNVAVFLYGTGFAEIRVYKWRQRFGNSNV